MPKKAREKPPYERLNVIVSIETAARIKELKAKLSPQRVNVSTSAIIETALAEFLQRKDAAEVLRRHKARARREWPLNRSEADAVKLAAPTRRSSR